MAYTVTELITRAYYASGIVAREFEAVDGAQLEDGLNFLNDILDEKRVDDSMIPYETSNTFDTIIGQESYEIENLIDVDTLTFELDSVRYHVSKINRDSYFGNSRANNITSLPLTYHLERMIGGAIIYLYFLPDAVYPVTMRGIFNLSQVSLNQDLSLTLDRFYVSYLRYELARRLCVEFDCVIPGGLEGVYQKIYADISKRSRTMDLRMKKISTFGSGGTLNYAQVNLGNGWTAP